MNEKPEQVVAGEIVSDEELADFIDHGDLPSYHTVLEVWREVLKPHHDEKTKKVTPQWASRITASYRELDFADMDDFRDRYFAKLTELEKILLLEIESDPEALSYTSPEEDAATNHHHYMNLLMLWQQSLLGWEMAWTCTDESAPVELAAISEVHKMFFAEQGLTAFLENIQLVFTDDDQQMLADALLEMRGEG